MNRESLVLIQGDDVIPKTLRKLVTTWPHVVRSEEVDITQERWARIADVEVTLLERLWDQLFASGLCNADGTIAPEAASFIQAIAAQSLSKRRGKG